MIRRLLSPPLLALAIGLCSSVCVPAAAQAQAPPGSESVPVGVLLQRAAPSVHWTADGLLVYSVGEGDSVSLRALRRTGESRVTDYLREHLQPSLGPEDSASAEVVVLGFGRASA